MRRHILLLSMMFPYAMAQKKPKLHTAIKKGKLHEVTELVSKEALQERDKKGNTPLHVAAKHGRTDIARHLLEAGINVHARNYDGETPLHTAAEHGNADVVQVFIDYGADVNAKTYAKIIPLYMAAMYGQQETAQRLLDRTSEVNVRDTAGKTPLYVAVREGHIQVARLLLTYGAHVDAATQMLKTPLYKAVSKGYTQLVVLLLSHGANPDIVTRSQQSPFKKAVQDRNLEITSYLLAFGAPWYHQLGKLSAYDEMHEALHGYMPDLKQISVEQALRILAGNGYNNTISTYLLNNTLSTHHQHMLLSDVIMLDNYGLAEKLAVQVIGKEAQVSAFERVATHGTMHQIQRLADMSREVLTQQRKKLSERAQALLQTPQQ